MADSSPLQRSGSARSTHSLASRTPSMRLTHSPSPSHSHRQSFTDQMRGLPPSPRSNRHLSLSQAQIQDLVNNPPTAGSADPAFAGRDWQHITVEELVNPEDLNFVELDTGVEAATNVGAINLRDPCVASASHHFRSCSSNLAHPFSSFAQVPQNKQLSRPSTTAI